MNDTDRPAGCDSDPAEPESQRAAASSAANGQTETREIAALPEKQQHSDLSTAAADPVRKQIQDATRMMRVLDSPTMRALRDYVDSPVARMMREHLDSPTARALRDYANSPAVKMMRDYVESPAAKALRDYAESPAARTLRALADSPAAKVLREFADSPTARMLRDLSDSPTTQALRHYADSPIARELARYRDGTIALGRTDRWALQLSTTNALAGLTGISANVAELDRIRGVVNHISRFGAGAVVDVGLSSGLAETRLKVAALAGSADLLGFGAGTTVAAYARLFGGWRTRLDLPDHFWNHPDHRRGYYAEAEVDAGLIEATPETVVAVTIESGLAGGISDGKASVATFEIGGMSMQIRSANFQLDAFQAVDRFERTLRLLITQKLAALVGPRWFKQRVDEKMREKARGNRAAAMANGERDEELICYLDLGDLTGILLRKDNWDGAFGHVFPNRERLIHDLQALVALRRPTMHARNLDGVQLVELMCVIRRLMQFIDGDGVWKRIADSED
ncbi:hypothetical protein [Bradyrhizobium sp. USDA 4502]